MDKRLSDVLSGRPDNYLLPFYWQHGNHTERIPAQVKRIYNSGARALCVESRPHPDFGGEGWWRDMDVILAECEKLGMKVWALDDNHFPTGNANGLVASKYPERQPWVLVERHLDVIGPMADTQILFREQDNQENHLVGVYAYRRSGEDENLTGEPVCLTDHVKGGSLYWDVPEGCWRIFILQKSRRGAWTGHIDMISEESVAVQIEAVYEPHYQHYAKYFGNTLAGFFSDEPCFGNTIVGTHRMDWGFYEHRIGRDGQALPYNERLLAMMSEELGEDAMPYLGELWYYSEHAHLTRLAYMNAVTRLYRDCFCYQLGNWCRAHGVEYIGHIIEDMNAHGRLGSSAGHYFRALEGQDMSGIDIVLHQVMPGMGHYMHTASCSGGMADPEFFHYVLGQLGASLSHQIPRMNNRAMCEVFGAYGWGEGSVMMRWLMDFLLVRGVNHFVPHAFSPDFPDGDCPPHFGAEGFDPNYDGFSALMRYTNEAAHLLTGGNPLPSVAILYHAEGEWMSAESSLTQKPAKALYDRQINYDILCVDVLEKASVQNGRLLLNGVSFGALIIPYADYLPENLLKLLQGFAESGLPVLYADALPAGAQGRVVPCGALADTLLEMGVFDIRVEGSFPELRFYHINRDGSDVFMFFNESAALTADTTVSLPCKGDFARLRLLEDVRCGDTTADGKVHLHLIPGQSEIWVFGDKAGLPAAKQLHAIDTPALRFKVEIAPSSELVECGVVAWKPYAEDSALFNMSAPEHQPDFSGKMRYSFDCALPEGATALDLGRVGQNARLFVNGEDCGIRIAAPYTFDLTGRLREGVNHFEVVVSNTLAQRERDWFSYFLQLEPSGLLGPLTFLG